MFEIAVGDPAGKTGQASERLQHPKAYGRQDQRESKEELPQQEQKIRLPVLLKSPIHRAIVHFQLDKADLIFGQGQPFSFDTLFAKSPLRLLDVHKRRLRGIADRDCDAHDLRVEQGSLGNRLCRVQVVIPGWIGQTIGEEFGYSFEMPVHLLIDLIQAQVRKDLSADECRQNESHTHGDQDASAKSAKPLAFDEGREVLKHECRQDASWSFLWWGSLLQTFRMRWPGAAQVTYGTSNALISRSR